MNGRHLGAACCLTVYLFPILGFAMSGSEWYKAGSELLVISDDQRRGAPLDNKVKYRECQIEANRVWCEANLEGDTQNVTAAMSPARKTQLSEQLAQVCPTSWHMPFGGPFVIMVQELEKRGGPSFFEKWLSASNMLHDSLDNLRVRDGAFDAEVFDPGVFDTDCLLVELQGDDATVLGQQITAIELARRVLAYWQQQFAPSTGSP